MLTHIEFENYRIFKRRQVLDIKPITILFGKNNAGKSAVLKLPSLIASINHSETRENFYTSYRGVRICETYRDLIYQIRQNFKNIPTFFEIFCIDKNNREIKINNEENYKTTEDILFIRESEKKQLELSLFEKNYNKLSDSRKEKLDDKFGCILCSIIIKNENPYLCYKCQKIFHEKCLKDWDNKCKIQNNNLACPSCRNELPIEQWNKKIDYEEKRKEAANLINTINELKESKVKQFNLIKKYEKYIGKTIDIFRNILYQIRSINYILGLKYNNKLIL